MSTGDEEWQSDMKKLRISLNISGTCELINNIELSNTHDRSVNVSGVVENVREEFEEDDWLREEGGRSGTDSDGGWNVERDWDGVSEPEEGGGVKWQGEGSLTESDSTPPLASTEPDSSGDDERVSSFDSGS